MLRIGLFSAFTLACLLCAGQAQADRMHRVGAGQTLSHVARRYKVSVYDIKAHNRLRSASLQLGQVLSIPPRGIVYVRPGQTLSHVAREHDCSIAALARTNHMRASDPLRAGQRLRLPGFAPPAHDKDWGEPSEPGVVTLLVGGDRLPVRLVDAQGRVSRRGVVTLSEILHQSDHGSQQPAHPRLALLLAKLSDHFGGRPIRIVSGFRDAGGFTSDESRHVSGRAADIQITGVPRRTVWEACRRLQGVGCGFYPNSVFTHVDARHSRTQWVDWSGPGRKPRYGTLRGPTRNRERRRRMPYPEIAGEVPLSVEIVEDAFVALGDDGTPRGALKVTALDDREPNPQGDSDIAEQPDLRWVELACLAPAPAWVPLSARRDPAGETRAYIR